MSEMSHFIHKTVSRIFSAKSDSPICRSHDYQSSDWHVTWQAGANWEWPLSWHHSSYITLIMTSSFCLHKDGGFTKVSAKNIHDFRHQITHFLGLIFQKPLTCIRNNIVLHAYFYLKCNENSRKAAHHAQLVQRVVSYAPCVCVCVMLDFRILHHFTRLIIMGDVKIFVQNKIFSRPTDPTFWAVCNWNQTIILSRPYPTVRKNFNNGWMDCFKGLQTFISPSCIINMHYGLLKVAVGQSGLLGKLHSSFAYFNQRKEYPQTINIYRKHNVTINNYWDQEKWQLFYG